jgi:hypothetical protein
MEDLKNINIDNKTMLCPFVIENVYTNIPKDEINMMITEILNTCNIFPITY